VRVEAILAARGGASRREDLLAEGVSRREIQAAVRRGAVGNPGRGCYSLPDASGAVVAAAIWRGRPTCVSALESWAVPLVGRMPAGVHIAVPRNRGVTTTDPRWSPSVVVHRGPALTGVPEVDAAAVVFHASRCLDPEALLIAVDHLLNRRLVEKSDIRCVTARLTRWVATTCDRGAASPPETLARLALLRSGFSVRSQVQFGGIGRVDLVVEDAVVVEVDGRAYHSDPVAFVADRQRDRALQGLGFWVLRCAAAEVLGDPGCVARAVAVHLGERAPRV
jgi:very-short-patch-repair endonuclease